jgi:N-acetyl-beta-hexosaminidase
MPNSPKRDSAIRGFAEGYAWQDPKTAIAWAKDIQDPTIRNESLKKVGFAYYRRKPEEAKTWLAESGLSSEAKADILNSQRRR